MKYNYTIISIFIFIATVLLISCKKLDTSALNGITPVSIKFLRSDSTIIKPGDCVSPYFDYLLEINVKIDNASSNLPRTIEYTYNDSTFKVEFTKTGKKYTKVKFIEGVNKAQLTLTTLKDSLVTHFQEFELVN
jgi:hypothetical protein